MAIVQVSIVPIGTGTTSVSDYVARAVSILEGEKGTAYQVTPMGTVIEGNLENVLGLVRRMHESVFSDRVQRVLTTIIIDDRRDRTATMESKVSAVKNKLGGK